MSPLRLDIQKLFFSYTLTYRPYILITNEIAKKEYAHIVST